MKFEIIVPIYNVEGYLERCLNSIKNQTYNDYIVRLVDDGSTDSSGIIAKKYAVDNRNFIYYHKENGGLSSARNYGIDRIQGEYVLFVDSDDYIDKNMLMFLNSELEKHKVDVLEFNAWIVEDEKENKPLNIHYIDEGTVKKGDKYFADNLKNGCLYSAVVLKCVESSLFKNGGLRFKDGLLHEDELWTPQLMLRAKKIKYVDKKLYYYYQRIDSIMHTKDRTQNYKDAKKVFYELETLYDSLNIPKNEVKIYKSYLSRKMIGVCQMEESRGTKKEREFIWNNAFDLKSKVQSVLFLLSPNLLKTIKPYIKRITRYEKEKS